jgi:RNA recognition motif-containing protein
LWKLQVYTDQLRKTSLPSLSNKVLSNVERIKVPTDRETRQMNGFAFVEIAIDAEEEKAIA